MKECIRVNTKNKSVLTKFQMSQLDEMLDQNNFLRIHRSFVVAKDKIEAFQRDRSGASRKTASHWQKL